MSEAKVGLSATVWAEVVGLFMVVLEFVNVFGFVPLHVLKPAMRITVSINMLFGIAVCYSREPAPATRSEPIGGAGALSTCSCNTPSRGPLGTRSTTAVQMTLRRHPAVAYISLDAQRISSA